MYTWSGMPTCAQYDSFVDTSLCVEPTDRICCDCGKIGNTCGTNRNDADPDVCCETEVEEELEES
jgi:hypothetical protein